MDKPCDFHVSEANVFANYALACILTAIPPAAPSRLAKTKKACDANPSGRVDYAARETESRLTNSSNKVPRAPEPLELR
jgi:hypothetical protein